MASHSSSVMAVAIPKKQKAALIENPGPNAKVVVRDDIPVAEPGENEVLIKLRRTGLCGSDVRAFLGWGPYNAIVGHEGVGVIVKTGANVTKSRLNQRVGVKWLYNVCGTCSVCRKGSINTCPSQLNTGRHVAGTLQQYVVADARYVSVIPNGLSDDIAAPLLCAGLTMAGAISKLDDDLAAGDWVVISGSGGGLGHLGVQLATRLREYRVIAIDTSEPKRKLSMESGAEVFLDFASDDVEARVKSITGGEGANAVIVVSGSEDAFKMAPKLVRNSGSIVSVGLPKNDFNLPISASLCAAKDLTVKGVFCGSEVQMDYIFGLALEGIIRPSIEVLEFTDAGSVIKRLRDGEVTARIVVKIPE